MQSVEVLTCNRNYDRNFKQIEKLGKGGYGEVFKVKAYKSIICAIKMIKFNAEDEKDFINELENSPLFQHLNHENVLSYGDVWLENDFTVQNKIKIYSKDYILYIGMELCDISLYDIIEEIRKDSNLFSNELITELGFYILSDIFSQMLNGVNYLHKQSKPIIHRDLRPDNIMLKIDENGKNIVKIADIGLVKLHEYGHQSHTSDRGLIKYMAPEVEQGTKYDTRADIYSLGIVLRELFVIDVNRY